MAQKRILSPAQDMAANPTENIWVQANAGTGKTSVLVQRLLRILFRCNDTDNTGILCLTYTNAGAGEMRNRILAAVREWAMATDDDLRDLLYGVAENNPATDDDLCRAREIFFRYIDNPNILKIKTIHGFCEEILRRFPIEAGISPSWTLVSDSAQKQLMQDAFHHLINSSGSDARVGDTFAHIVGRISENYLGDLMAILTAQYKNFFDIENIDNYRKYFIDTTRKFLELDTPIQADVSPEYIQNIINLTQNDQNSLKKPVKYLENIINLSKQFIDKTINFEEYKLAYITSTGTPRKDVAKKEYLAPEQDRVYQLDQRNANEQIMADTTALFDLAAAFAHMYRELKHRRNALDFDDLILYTRRLFSAPDTMGWVLSQLDVSLKYILVDEAQDTSPQQWDILRMLAGDFFVDGDSKNNRHSMFVVGDTKQSIYGFQGADPNAFAASRDEIAAQIQNNMRTIQEVPLTQSFRSSAPILQTVDRFFEDPGVIEISNFANNKHACFRGNAPGLVELHKLISKQTDETTLAAYLRDIVDKITDEINNGCTPGDIMILVQNRHPMVDPLVKELKRRNIDVAGSDRIILPDFPAVRDLLNVVRFCLDETDDYSLCCVLKSPLFRLNDDDIFKLCIARGVNGAATPATVFNILADTHPDIHARLMQILQWSKDLSPYSFFSRILDTNNTRDSMIAALGTQIIDPLSEFMTICLAYERTQPGTLHHFLKWFITGDSQIKRDLDKSSGVRIVTVHGSKGLEAPVVFLIDTVRMPKAEQILPIPTKADSQMPHPWIWTPRGDNSAHRAIAAAATMQDRIAEYYRLLYVAMTRARDRLYIYGYTALQSAPSASWHAQLWRVLANDTDIKEIRIANDD